MKPFIRIDNDRSNPQETRAAYIMATAEIFKMRIAKTTYCESYNRMLKDLDVTKYEPTWEGFKQVAEQIYFEGWIQGGFQMLTALTEEMVELQVNEISQR